MSKLIATSFILLSFWNDLGQVSRINESKARAEKAFLSKDYASAVRAYAGLVKDMQVSEPEVLLNLAHSYFHLQKADSAAIYYEKAAGSAAPAVASTAWQQLGLLADKKGDAKAALDCLRKALTLDPQNQIARYNYELLKKRENKPQDPKQPPTPFAEELYRKARALVAQKQYAAAVQLMTDGVKKDPSILSNYGQFIQKTNDIAQIAKL